MADGFVLKVTEGAAELVVTVAGVVSEESRFELPDIGGRRVVIDASAVERINSLGVRSWIDFMEQLDAHASEVVIRHLSPALVAQASMITNFVGRSRIESFLSPWFCPRCEHATELAHAYRDDLPPTVPCPRCSGAMELDWDRDAYLAFRSV